MPGRPSSRNPGSHDPSPCRPGHGHALDPRPGQELIWFLRLQPRQETEITAIRASVVALDLSQFDPVYDDDGNPLPPDRVAARLEASLDGRREILAGEEIGVPGRVTLPDPATIATRDPGALLRW